MRSLSNLFCDKISSVVEGKQSETRTREAERAILKINLQPSISEAVAILSQFTVQEGIPAIVSMLSFFEMAAEVEEATLIHLRKQLTAIMLKESSNAIKNHQNISLSDAAQVALYALALLKPFNEKGDFAYGEPIPLSDLILTTDGYQFNIHSLIKFHNERNYQGKPPLNELHNKKHLLNPYTMKPIHPYDVQVVKAIAKKSNKPIENLWQDIVAKPVISVSLGDNLYPASEPIAFLSRVGTRSLHESISLPATHLGFGIFDRARGTFFSDAKSNLGRLILTEDQRNDLHPDLKLNIPSFQRRDYYLTDTEKAVLGISKSFQFDRYSVRKALNSGLMTIQQMAAMSSRKLELLFCPIFSSGLELLKEGLISIDQINAINADYLKSLCVKERMADLIRNGVFTMEQFSELSWAKYSLVDCSTELQNALEERRLSAAAFILITDDEARDILSQYSESESSFRLSNTR